MDLRFHYYVHPIHRYTPHCRSRYLRKGPQLPPRGRRRPSRSRACPIVGGQLIGIEVWREQYKLTETGWTKHGIGRRKSIDMVPGFVFIAWLWVPAIVALLEGYADYGKRMNEVFD